MRITMEVPLGLEIVLRHDAEEQGRSIEDVAAARLAEFYEAKDGIELEAVEGIAQGLAAAAAGDEMPFEEYVAQRQARREARRLARTGAMEGPE